MEHQTSSFVTERQRPLKIDRWITAAVATCTLITLFLGGTSRDRSVATAVVYASNVAFLLLYVFTFDTRAIKLLRMPLLFLGGVALVGALQLIPFPPTVWQNLAAHALLIESADAVGMEQPWRPISIAPSLTMQSLMALFPPTTMLVGLASISGRSRIGILCIVVAAAIVSAIMGVVQVTTGGAQSFYLFGPGLHDYSVGLFSNRNHQAIFLSLVIPMLRVLCISNFQSALPKSVTATLFWPTALLLLGAILISGSRTGLIVSFFSFGMACYLVPPKLSPLWQRFDRRGIWVVFAVGILFLLLSVFVTSDRAASFDRLLNRASYNDELRFAFWPVIARSVMEFLPLGSGLGTFDVVFRIFEPDWALKSTYFNHAHSDPLEVALTMGVAGILITMGLITWYVATTARLLRAYLKDRRRYEIEVACCMGVLMLGMASMADYPLRTPTLAATFAILLGVMAFARHEQSDHRHRHP